MEKKGESQEDGNDDGYLYLMAGIVKQQIEDACDNRVPLRKGERRRRELEFGGVRASGAALARNTGILDMKNGVLGLVGASWVPSRARLRQG